MTAPIAVTPDYINLFGSTFALVGTPNVTYKILSGALKITSATDDFTNNESAGWTEDVVTTRTAESDEIMLGYQSGNAPLFKSGEIWDVTITDPGGRVIAGHFMFNDVGYPIFNAKDGYKIPFKIKSQKAITIT